MTKDLITLTPDMPSVDTILAGLFAGGPDLGVSTVAQGPVVQLHAPDGHPLVSIEAPQLVHVPGEAERLLGSQVPLLQGPFWWTEARATTAVPEAARLAGSFAGRVAAALGGTVWPPDAAHTNVVPLTTDTTTLPAPAATSAPALDLVTDQAAVVMQDRPVVAMTTWLTEAVRTAAETDRALQLLTPPHTRLTLPARDVLRAHPNRWVVQDPDCGYYDGLGGAQLHWKDGAFTPVRDEDGNARRAPAFQPASTGTGTGMGERQLTLSLHTTHPATEDLTLGHALEAAFHHLTGRPPVGWNTAEPIALPWSTRQLTDLARNRAPKPTWLAVIGHPDRPAIATLRITRTPAGVEEHATLTLGHASGERPPLDAVAPLAETLAAEHNLTSMLTTLRTARRDLTVPPHFEPLPSPLTFTLGPHAVHDIGLAHAGRPPLALRPVPLGPATRPALHYPLGDGADPTAWTTFQQLSAHLKSAPEASGRPSDR
ncbi:DUF6177 family protein [Streptomyces alboniger]|nr:DUF6177 family protein [Streptomyces alboniger]